MILILGYSYNNQGMCDQTATYAVVGKGTGITIEKI